MEELDKKTNVEELIELMEKIELSMEMSRNRQSNIDKITEELYDETRPMMVEKRKEELENAKSDKAEFDEMTKNALINAKKHILQLREEREKEYQAKLLHTVDRQTDIQEKLLSMKKKGLPAEKLMKAEEAANRAIVKVNNSMKEFQNNHFELRKKLEDYEKKIWNDAVELGVEKEMDAVTLEEKVELEKTEPPKQEPPKQEPPKQEPPKQKPPKQEPPKQEPPKQEPPKQEPPKQEPPKQEPPKQEPPKQEPPKQELPKTELKWHKKLTPEQIEEAISKEIYKPEGQEYEQFLAELGIDKEEKSSPLRSKQGQTPPTPLTPPKPPKSEKEVTKIIINPLENKIDYYFNDNKHNSKGWKAEDTSGLSYENSKIKNVVSILENIGEKGDLSDISEMIDPNIVELLARKSKEFNIQIDDYLNMLRGKDSNFNIEYDLRDIYNSDLDYKQIKNINKIATMASIKTNGAISYEKDNILKRAFGNIKKRIEYVNRKMLTNGSKEKKEETKDDKPKDSRLSKVKDKTKEKLNDAKDFASTKLDDAKHFTSRKLTTVKRLGRETLGTLNIAGTRISGYFKGENPLVTNMKVNNIRAKSFVPKATVDEKVAVEKVEASQRQNEEVIIENPDGTKQIGHRLWSKDDENTK